VEPSLMVVGLNYRTAPMAVRERFWIDESQRYQALIHLSRAEGIEEVIILSTCNRTEFFLWANDVTLAANSVMRLLGVDFGLKLEEWKHFYRLLDQAALLHIFRVVSRLDSMVVGAPQIVPQAKAAWQQAEKIGASARFLDAVMQKALAVSERIGRETAILKAPASIPSTAVKLARQIFGPLANKKVLVLGAGEMGELSACELIKQSGGSVSVSVINRTFEHAAELAAKLGGTAFPFEDRWHHMAEADIIIGATSCPHRILSRDEAERVMAERKLRAAAVCAGSGAKKTHPIPPPLLIADLAMPRDIDPAVRNVKGIFLYDLDDLENVADDTAAEREAAAAEAQKILRQQALGFCRTLLPDTVVPTIVQVCQRLDEVCRKELNAFREENGPFSKDQDEMLNAVLARMTQRISASLAREIKEVPEKVEQEQMTQALQRLFHLPTHLATEDQRNVSSKSA
jgi:glutamyl-tRNA reductase